MKTDYLKQKCESYLKTLCTEITDRSVGSEGNRRATLFFENELTDLGWKTETLEFQAVDWKDGGAELNAGDKNFRVQVSPYSKGCSVKAKLAGVSDSGELEHGNFQGKIILLHGPVAAEQLMPKNFVFYNPDSHKKIISLLEKSGASALVCATGRNSALAGGVYPFPLIEDGDFDIPSVFMTEEEGAKLLPHIGRELSLTSRSERIPGKGYNVSGLIGANNRERIVITAHIDAKKGSPGAIDNATGIAVLLMLAELLKDYQGDRQIELVAFNGEDYYSVPGQMAFIHANQDSFSNIILNINIDGAGYMSDKSSFSFFNLPDNIHKCTIEVMKSHPGITEGVQWPQGDHSIFVQQGIPAIAISSKWFIDNIETQDITHTKKDVPEIVNCGKLVEISAALNILIRNL